MSDAIIFCMYDTLLWQTFTAVVWTCVFIDSDWQVNIDEFDPARLHHSLNKDDQ